MPGENPRSIADGAMADETYCLDESERVKYLRAAVARLAIKNQRIRFQLHAAAQKIEQIKKLLFDLRDHPVNRSVDLEFLLLLRDLCWASESPEAEPVGNVAGLSCMDAKTKEQSPAAVRLGLCRI